MKEEKLLQAIFRIGFAFVVLHFDIRLGWVNLLPDWLGYGMIVSSLDALAAERPTAELLRPLGYLLVVWSLAVSVVNLLGGSLQTIGAVVIVSVVRLYFQFQLLTELAAIAEAYTPRHTHRILQLRTVMTLVVTGYALLSAVVVHEAVTAVTAVVYCVAALWLCRVLLRLENDMSMVLCPEAAMTFAQRIERNMENEETAEG